MKYKEIRAMAHNWTHSFMSGNNYLDGRFAYEDMHALARAKRPAKVVVSWLPQRDEELSALTPRVREVIKHYRNGLAKHLQHHRIERSALVELRTEVYVANNFRIYVRAYARDDRGKEHEAYVWA